MSSRWRNWDPGFATELLERNADCRIYPVSGGRGRPALNLSTVSLPDTRICTTLPEKDSLLEAGGPNNLRSVRGRGRRLKIGEQLGSERQQEFLKNLNAIHNTVTTVGNKTNQSSIFTMEDFPSITSSVPTNQDKNQRDKDGNPTPQWLPKQQKKAQPKATSQQCKNKEEDRSEQKTVTEKTNSFPRTFLKTLKEPHLAVLIENISLDATYKDLHEFFSSFGDVKSLEIRHSSALITMVKFMACVWIVSCLDESRDIIGKPDVNLRAYLVSEMLEEELQ